MGRSPLGAHTRRRIGFSPMRCSSVAQTSTGLSGCWALASATACSSFFTTAAKLAVWQTGAVRFAVELEGRDGQTPVKDAGSGTHLTPAAPPVPGVRGRDAHPL